MTEIRPIMRPEIRSNSNAGNHSNAISRTAEELKNGLEGITQSQNNKPETSLISCFSNLRSAIVMLSYAICDDAANIQAIGEAINSTDNELKRRFFSE